MNEDTTDRPLDLADIPLDRLSRVAARAVRDIERRAVGGQTAANRPRASTFNSSI